MEAGQKKRFFFLRPLVGAICNTKRQKSRPASPWFETIGKWEHATPGRCGKNVFHAIPFWTGPQNKLKLPRAVFSFVWVSSRQRKNWFLFDSPNPEKDCGWPSRGCGRYSFGGTTRQASGFSAAADHQSRFEENLAVRGPVPLFVSFCPGGERMGYNGIECFVWAPPRRVGPACWRAFSQSHWTQNSLPAPRKGKNALVGKNRSALGRPLGGETGAAAFWPHEIGGKKKTHSSPCRFYRWRNLGRKGRRQTFERQKTNSWKSSMKSTLPNFFFESGSFANLNNHSFGAAFKLIFFKKDALAPASFVRG